MYRFIFTFRRKAMLQKQHYRCAGCGLKVTPSKHVPSFLAFSLVLLALLLQLGIIQSPIVLFNPQLSYPIPNCLVQSPVVLFNPQLYYSIPNCLITRLLYCSFLLFVFKYFVFYDVLWYRPSSLTHYQYFWTLTTRPFCYGNCLFYF